MSQKIAVYQAIQTRHQMHQIHENMDFHENTDSQSDTEVDVSFSCVCPVIDHEFRYNIVKVAVDPRGDSDSLFNLTRPNS